MDVQEPETIRHQRSPRQAYGKGLPTGNQRRGVIYIAGFFLWALDAKTGSLLKIGAGAFLSVDIHKHDRYRSYSLPCR